jgi:hypothetical protein
MEVEPLLDVVSTRASFRFSRGNSAPSRLQEMGYRMAARLAQLEAGELKNWGGTHNNIEESDEEDCYDLTGRALPRSWNNRTSQLSLHLPPLHAMPVNAWSELPLPVLDVLFRMGLSFFDLRSVGMTCKRLHAAVFQKVPFSKAVFTENARAMERKRQRHIEAMREERRQRYRRTARELASFGFAQLPALIFFLVGLTGLLHFPELARSVSTVPNCPNTGSMLASLYSCCAFWLLASVIYGAWTVVVHDVLGISKCGPLRTISTRGLITDFKFFFFLAMIGVWTSAAACVHFSNSCTSVAAAVAFPARAFAATSLAFGLLGSLLGGFVLFLGTR